MAKQQITGGLKEIGAHLSEVDRQALEMAESVLQRMEASLGGLRSTVIAKLTRTNVILADLQKRVSALEQKQGAADRKEG